MAHIRSVFITGSNRGIGLEFVRQLAELPKPPKAIFATCRNPDGAKELQSIASNNKSVHIHKLDILDYSSYPAIVQWVSDTLGSDEGLNVLINNAAVSSWRQGDLPVERDVIMYELETNTVAPLMLSQALLPLIQKAADAGGDGMSCSRAAIINISSRSGSIGCNIIGSWYAYRSSKAALNMITKTLSIDLKSRGILAVAMHPGRVQTEMGDDDAPLTTAVSVEAILKVIHSFDNDSSGRFYNFDGETLPW